MENLTQNVHFMVDIEYSSTTTRKNKWKDIDVEPSEKEIIRVSQDSARVRIYN